MRTLTTILFLSALLPAHADTLYDPATFRAAIADRRAHAVGDNLTVLIVESASATSSADAVLRRNSGTGLQASIATHDPHRLQASAAITSDFSGGGTVQRSDRLLASITASVVGVAANGDLLLRGEQQLEINRETQRIRLEGRVRKQDIGDTNTVLSSRLADARISYAGDGALAEQQHPGWLSRALAWLGL